jgi:hypothetical protein
LKQQRATFRKGHKEAAKTMPKDLQRLRIMAAGIMAAGYIWKRRLELNYTE